VEEPCADERASCLIRRGIEMATSTTLEERYGKTFERTLTYLLLFDPGFSEQVTNGIDPSLFHNVHYKEIASAFCLLVSQRNGMVPTYASIAPILKKRLTGKTPSAKKEIIKSALQIALKMKKHMKFPSDADIKTVQNELGSFISHRNLQAALLESVDLLDEGKFEEIQELISHAAKSGEMSVVDDPGLEYTNIKERLKFYQDAKVAEFHAPIGVRKIDDIMRGGLEPGALGIFLAPTGIGKTRALVNVGAMCVCKGLNVVHISMEIPAKEIGHRYDARMTGVPINAMAQSPGKYDKKLYHAAKKLKGRLFIKSWSSGAASVTDIRAYLKQRTVQDDFVPQVILVDYIDLLRPIRKRREIRFELADTTRALRGMAQDFACATWTASQTVKANWDSEVLSLSSIAEAGEKANVADAVIGMCQTAAEKRKKLMRMIILKNRQGGKEKTSVDCNVTEDTQVIQQSPIQRTQLKTGATATKGGTP